ncbi:hypothetical protein Acr_24g0007770 [Actinidia rufa]|uniref:Reverse transcriptase/retrotransposon-derived protein RNase H-like domain-containing protein n=1 Tax=Actinidia rufa TaxID=165716 RepID=A0A7J0GUS0_9ERIC|nr:hypothetical protein Acr_24g0007770 [Actinidia rufa]
MTDYGFVRAEASIKLSLWSKLGGPLRQSSVNTSTVRPKAIATSELSLFSKFGRITTLELGQGATAGVKSQGMSGDRRRQPGHNHPTPANLVGRNGSTDPASAWKTRAILNPLRRASGEYRPTEFPSTNLREILNAKRNRGGDLCNKFSSRTVAASRKTSSRRSQRLEQPGPNQENQFRLPRYQTPFSRDVEGIDLPEKFTPPRFTLYDEKSDPRSPINHVRQMMALWNHLDALMCRVFPSSLGDLGLKWFDLLPGRSIGSFHQLTESFVARFVINTKALKGVGSFLTLRKGQNESLCNYNKHYWETYNEIEECSEEISCLGSKMFTRLENDVRQKEQNTDSTPRSEGQFKIRKEVSADHENWQGKGSIWSSKNRYTSSLPESEISRTSRSLAPWEWIPKVRPGWNLKEFVTKKRSELRKPRPNQTPSLTRDVGSGFYVAPSHHQVCHHRGEETRYGDQIAAKQCYLTTISTKAAMNEVQLIEKREVLEDVGREPEAKVMEDLIRYELEEPSSDRFFLTDTNLQATRKEIYTPPHTVIEEVEKSKEASAIIEVLYPSWLFNIDVVKKKTRKWRVCVEFTSLNWACSKDCFPLPKIDQLVDSTSGPSWLFNTDVIDQLADSTSGHTLMSFLDAYRAPYQTMITKIFEPIMGKPMDAYIDDMVVKRKGEPGHVRDLTEVFAILRKHKLRLNAANCAFEVSLGKFLGHLVTRREIEANPEQIIVISNLVSPRTAKEVQKLTGMATTLNRFISKSSNKCRSFFQQLRKNRKFLWNECELALQQFKKYVTELPLISTPDEGELLYVYLIVSNHAASSVLLREVDGEQRPIYFVRKTFTDCQRRYLPLKKLVLALVLTLRKLSHYFQAHPIAIYTEFLLKNILSSISVWPTLQMDQQGCLAFQPKPGDHEVNRKPPQNTKTTVAGEISKVLEVVVEPPQIDLTSAWEIFVDRAKNSLGMWAGSANKLKVPELHIFSDSKLVVNQVTWKFEARGAKMAKYLAIAKAFLTEFKADKIEQVGRDLNSHIDALAGLASVFEGEIGHTIAVDLVSAPSLEMTRESILVNTELGLSWMDPIVNFMRHDKLLEDKKEAHNPNKSSTVLDLPQQGPVQKIVSRILPTIIGLPSPNSGILVAIHAKGCPGVRLQMYQVLALLPFDSSASKGLDPSHQLVALCPMGNGYREGSASSSGEQKKFVSSDRRLHKIGGGRTTSPNQGDGRNQIQLQKHSIQIRYP